MAGLLNNNNPVAEEDYDLWVRQNNQRVSRENMPEGGTGALGERPEPTGGTMGSRNTEVISAIDRLLRGPSEEMNAVLGEARRHLEEDDEPDLLEGLNLGMRAIGAAGVGITGAMQGSSFRRYPPRGPQRGIEGTPGYSRSYSQLYDRSVALLDRIRRMPEDSADFDRMLEIGRASTTGQNLSRNLNNLLDRGEINVEQFISIRDRLGAINGFLTRNGVLSERQIRIPGLPEQLRRTPDPGSILVPVNRENAMTMLTDLDLQIIDVRSPSRGSIYIRFRDPNQPQLDLASYPQIRISDHTGLRLNEADLYRSEAGQLYDTSWRRAGSGTFDTRTLADQQGRSYGDLIVLRDALQRRFRPDLAETPSTPRSTPDPNQLELPLETIKESAIKIGDQTFTGHSHFHAIERAAEDLGISINEVVNRVNPNTDGFITSTGRFVDRREAARIAEQGGQRQGQHLDADRLASEDLSGRSNLGLGPLLPTATQRVRPGHPLYNPDDPDAPGGNFQQNPTAGPLSPAELAEAEADESDAAAREARGDFVGKNTEEFITEMRAMAERAGQEALQNPSAENMARWSEANENWSKSLRDQEDAESRSLSKSPFMRNRTDSPMKFGADAPGVVWMYNPREHSIEPVPVTRPPNVDPSKWRSIDQLLKEGYMYWSDVPKPSRPLTDEDVTRELYDRDRGQQ